MTVESAIALALAVLILGVTPGPGVLATVARVLASGLRRTLPFMLGIVAGDLVFLGLALVGLAVIATRYAPLFLAVKLVGGLYLIYLGIRLWRAAPSATSGAAAPVEHGVLRPFTSGLLITLSNPKVIVFYAGFLPAFTDLAALGPGDALIIAGIVALTIMVVLLGYGLGVHRARAVLRSARAARYLNRSAGGLMVGAGSFVAAS